MRSVLLAIIFILGVAPLAQANEFVWRDPVSKASLTFPDRWALGSNQQAGDVVTIYAPYTQGKNDFAMCRMRVFNDKRFTLFPRRYDRAIQHEALAQEFWADFVGDYRSAEVHSIHNDAGLGRGFASRANISFVTDDGAKVQKRGLVYASIYNDKLYAFECSADRLAFERWYPSFMEILGSFRIRQEHHERIHSYYRDFTG